MDELRERCAHAYYRLRWARDDWHVMQPVHREPYYEVADAVLAEIAAAGCVLVERGRMERVLRFAAMWMAEEFTDCEQWRNWANAGLEPGDLAGLKEGE